jgi:hypothetical protein
VVNKIQVIYVASDDPDFSTMEDTAILLADRIVLDNNYDDDEAEIYILDEPVEPGETLTIDRSTCKRFHINFFGRNDEVDADFLAECSFLDLVKAYAK